MSIDAKPLLSLLKQPYNRAQGLRFTVNNDTLEQESEQNKMFVVVRNVKSLPKGDDVPRFSGEYCIGKGDIIKMGRLKFLVRDYRSQNIQANIDSDNHCSPVKKQGLRMMDEEEEFA